MVFNRSKLRRLAFLTCLTLSIAYAALSLFNNNKAPIPRGSEHANDIGIYAEDQEATRHMLSFGDVETVNTIDSVATLAAESESTRGKLALPIRLSYVLMSSPDETPIGEEYALIVHQDDIQEFKVGDAVYLDSVILSDIKPSSVIVTYNNNDFMLNIDKSALYAQSPYASEYTEPVSQPTFEEYLAMTPEQINTRPKVLEHIFDLTPTRLLPEGMLVSAGINEALFRQAGFEPDDVLLAVNGMDIELDYTEIQNMMPSARMLTFDITRKGKRLTLYLDIPDEELAIAR